MRLPFRDPLGADNLGEIRKCWILMFVALEFFFFNLSLVSGIIKKKKKNPHFLTDTKENQPEAGSMTARTPCNRPQKTDCPTTAKGRSRGQEASRRGLVPGAQTQCSHLILPSTTLRKSGNRKVEIQNKSKARAHSNMHSSLLLKKVMLIWIDKDSDFI